MRASVHTKQIEKVKLINNTKELQINDLKIKPIPEGDKYKYLGIDENISYVGLVNKTRVTKEYYTRVKKNLKFRVIFC